MYFYILGAGILLRIILGYYSPSPHGYVYDFYADAIDFFALNTQIPTAGDCFICYHPPLFPIIGGLIFKVVAAFGGSYNAQHYYVAALTGVFSIVFCIYGFALYRRFLETRYDPLIFALLLVLPVVFISSFSIESDLFASMLMVISIYYFACFQERDCTRLLVLSGLFAGLAALTKYSGLVVCVILGGVLLYQFLRTRTADHFKKGVIFAALCTIFGAYPYINNLMQYGSPFAGNEAWHQEKSYSDIYHFDRFSLSDIVDVMHKDSQRQMLNQFPAYNNDVMTSFYGQLWTDFSFFSLRDRHGHAFGRYIYPEKDIPTKIVYLLLIAGLAPCLLSLFGLGVMVYTRQAPLLLLIFVITMAVYVNWMMGFHIWMIKTKYLMHLLPIWLLMLGYGLSKLRYPAIGYILLLPSILLSAVYCYLFAVS